jgi:hypothetical protein
VRPDFIDEHDRQPCPIVSAAARKRTVNIHTHKCHLERFQVMCAAADVDHSGLATAGADHVAVRGYNRRNTISGLVRSFFFKSSTMIHISRQLTGGRASATRYRVDRPHSRVKYSSSRVVFVSTTPPTGCRLACFSPAHLTRLTRFYQYVVCPPSASIRLLRLAGISLT